MMGKHIWTSCTLWVMALVGATFIAGSAHAAKIWAERSGEMQCTHMLSGPIQDGDFDIFLGLLQQPQDDALPYWPPRLCLDSIEGSFVEALRFARSPIDFGTALQPDAACLSACGIAFLSGHRFIEGGIGRIPDRHMHATARLGFHAPDLAPQEALSSQDGLQSAYSKSVLEIAELVSVSATLAMSHENLSTLLRTNPDALYLIDTVQRAVDWTIRVHGIQEPTTFTKFHMANACHVVTGGMQYGTNARAVVTEETGTIQGNVSFSFDDAGMITCDISYRRARDLFDLVDYDHIEDRVLFPAMFYLPDTKLAQLATSLNSVAMTFEPQRYERTAICALFADQKLVTREPCRVTERVNINNDLRRQIISTYVWPSSTETVVVANPDFEFQRCCGESYHLDGHQADALGAFADRIGATQCLRSTVTQTVFCTEPMN